MRSYFVLTFTDQYKCYDIKSLVSYLFAFDQVLLFCVNEGIFLSFGYQLNVLTLIQALCCQGSSAVVIKCQKKKQTIYVSKLPKVIVTTPIWFDLSCTFRVVNYKDSYSV